MQVPQILQQLNGGQISPQLQAMLPAINQAKQMMGVIRSAQNPSAMLQQMVQSNPQMQQAMQILNQSGGDPTGMVYALSQQKGINPNELMELLK